MTFILPVLHFFFGGVIQSLFRMWLNYKATIATSNEAGAVEGMHVDQQENATSAWSEVGVDALKIAVYGTFTYRLITLMVGIPVATHFSLVFVDTILASKLMFGHSVIGIPNPPKPYPEFEWYIIASFFLVHTVGQGMSNLTKWLGRGP